MSSINIAQDRLKALIHYDPETGVMTWKVNRGGGARAGDVAGYKERKGYITLKLDGQQYKAHRLAFIYMTGSVPEVVDHINQDKSDNRWVNLRCATVCINNRNQGIPTNNTTGCVGVYIHKPTGKWQASIRIKGRNKSQGLYNDYFEACCARKSAERKYKFHVNHGS